jgi:hypothetical protein
MNEEEDIRLCKNCKHVKRPFLSFFSWRKAICTHPDCINERENYITRKCGSEGKLYEPKDKLEQVLIRLDRRT